MKVPLAYLAVVLIWSTTPLGIVWSSETINPTMAVLLRMALAALLGTLFLLLLRIRLPLNKQAYKLYTYSSVGIFGGMICGYIASRYIGSGLISLVFGLSPLVSGLFAQKILNEPKFSALRLSAFLISVIGLLIVCWHDLTAGSDVTTGIIFVLFGMLFFSLSAVLVKSINISIHPLATTLGAIYFSLPLFIITWLLLDGDINTAQWSMRSISSIIYLGLFGSLIGFIAYFFILQNLTASSTALITLITPTFAITLGVAVNNEPVTLNLIIGASCIMIGLGVYQWGDKWINPKKQVVEIYED